MSSAVMRIGNLLAPSLRLGVPVALDLDLKSSWLRRLAVLLIAAKCFALPVVLDPRAEYAFAVPKASLSRALLYLLVTVLAAYVVAHGRRAITRSPVHLAAIPIVFAYVLATITAVHFPTALYGAPGRYLGLATLLDNAALALAVSICARTSRDLWLIVGGVFGGASVVLGYALVQTLGRDPIVWEGGGILFSTIGNQGPFAGYVVSIAAGLTALLVVGYRRLGWIQRVTLTSASLVTVAVVLMRGSRASAVALIPVGAVVLAVAARRHAPSMSADRRRSLAVGLVSSAIAALLLVVATPLRERIVMGLLGAESSNEERLVIYRAALAMLETHAILGVGPDNFVAVYSRVRESVPVDVAVLSESSTHSWLFKVATDAGALGLTAFLGLVALTLLRAWLSVRRPGHEATVVAGVVLIGFLGQGMLSLNDISTEWLPWLCIGLAAGAPLSIPVRNVRAGASRKRSSRRPPSADRGARRDRALAVVAPLLGLALSSTAINPLTASQLSKSALAALKVEDGQSAVGPALEATRRDAGRGEQWNALGTAYSRLGRPDAAIGAFRRATETEPYVSSYWINLANEELNQVARGSRQYAEAAGRDARAASEAAPTDPAAQYAYARVLNILGGHESDAARQAGIAASMAPSDATYISVAVTAYQRAGDLAHAIEWQKRAVDLAGGSSAQRMRLARLYLAVGDIDSAKRAIPPPRVKSVDRTCTSQNSGPSAADGSRQPLCFRVFLTSDDEMQADPSRSDSVRSRTNFAIDGHPLTDSTVIDYDPAQRMVVIQLPVGATPPSRNALVSVGGIANTLGFAIEPDPSMLQLP